MKTLKITYWASTGILFLLMLFSGFSYFTNPEMKQGFQHLGYPDYFRIELAIAKLIGAVLLIIPIHRSIKEWTYAGFAFTFVSAVIAHSSLGDPFSMVVAPIIFLAVLIISYFTYSKLGGKVTSLKSSSLDLQNKVTATH